MSLSKNVQFDEDNKELRTKMKEVTEAIIRIELNEDSFKGDDEKVRLYTGLTSWNLLAIVIHFIQPFINNVVRYLHSGRSS